MSYSSPLGDEQVRANPRSDAEVGRHAADHEAGVLPAGLQNPRQHGAGGRLAVGPRHDQGLPAADEELLQCLGQRDVPQPALKDGLDLLVASAHRVADDDQVGLVDEILGVVALHHADALLFEHRNHRRVHVLVGAGHVVTAFLQQRGHGAHRRAADPHHVDVANVTRHEHPPTPSPQPGAAERRPRGGRPIVRARSGAQAWPEPTSPGSRPCR